MSANDAWKAELQGLDDEEKAEWLRDAAWDGHLDHVSELIKAGADVNKGDGLGVTALMKTSMYRREACTDVLLKAGAELEQADDDGYTALMHACDCGHETIALALLNAGADPLAVNKSGQTVAQATEKQVQDQHLPAEWRERCRRCLKLLQKRR